MDAIGVIILIVLSILFSGSKKKHGTPAKGTKTAKTLRTKQSNPHEPPSRRIAPPPRAQQIDWHISNEDERKTNIPMPFDGAREGEDPCHEEILQPAQPSRVTYEMASEAQFAAASEGEDPCHPTVEHIHTSHLESEEIETPHVVFTEDDLVRAVIMSEILTRPKDRRRLHR